MTKIVSVDVYPLALGRPDGAPRAYATRPPWPSVYGNQRETLVVRLTADDGTAGWGEALAPVAPEVPGEIVRRLLAPVLLGADPRRVRPLRHRLGELMRERGHLGGHQADAIAAVDIALWDLAGKLADRPVVELLGGAFHDAVPTYVSGLPGRTDADRVAQARDWVGQGVRRVKVGLGYGVDADLATVSALRQVHPDLQVAVDVHGVYGLADAVRLGRGLADRDGWFLEMPLAFEDVAGHADLAARVDVPVALGESLRHRWEFQPFVTARAAGLLQPDIGRTGITEGLAIAQYAETHHLPVAPHHSAGLGLALAAGLHVAAACANLVAFEWHPTLFDRVNDILTVPIEPTPTAIPLPTGPGLGVSVDAEAVARHSTWGSR
ncbi:mandelate racemase/muconate lactonizing enzyme family protein [Micromonospora sp. NPDC052213]|uniref:mandelate racemase/muconate lactonizing enzyme family protein n=1 Tax=Micromonospora sp. NPDC052213 TaxID=3155812 RepID=UPI0034277CFB